MPSTKIKILLRRTLVAVAVIIIVLLLRDYFAPAELQVDLNAPRFRLVRHRFILPDQEFEMQWTHISDWSEAVEESEPIFGERSRAGLYAWEVQGRVMRRFETLYSEEDPLSGPSDEWIRTNYGCYWQSTGRLPKHDGPLLSRAEWVTRHPHQKSISGAQ
jgi:hypothetical protein